MPVGSHILTPGLVSRPCQCQHSVHGLRIFHVPHPDQGLTVWLNMTCSTLVYKAAGIKQIHNF